MFLFPESRLSDAIYSLQDTRSLLRVGSPIRISTALRMLTAYRRISLFAASFFASLCLGIRHTLFLTLPIGVLDHFPIYFRLFSDSFLSFRLLQKDLNNLLSRSLLFYRKFSIIQFSMISFKQYSS